MRVARLLLIVLALLPAMASSVSANNKTPPGDAAVGRLIVSGRSMCTGALVSPELVLTAAHCLYDPATGKRVRPRDIEFQAGLRQGTAKAVRKVSSTRQDPNYKHRRKGDAQTGHDLALLTLSRPISRKTVMPLAFDTGHGRGDVLAVMSYSIGNRSNPITKYPCKVLARQSDTLVMSCEVDFGASGAPVLTMSAGKRPALVSVVSARAAMGGRNVSVGTKVNAQTLSKLMAGG